MRLNKTFGELSPGDTFFIEGDNIEWLKIQNEDNRNVVSTNGVHMRSFEDSQMVKASRIRVHILDLRQGDQITMAENIDVAYNVSTVLKVWDEKGYRHATIARPMVNADGFGTTSPNAKLYLNQYNTMAKIGDYARDEFYYIVGIDTSALWDAHSFDFSADQFRMATYLRAHGDKREMAELLITDYRQLREKVMGLIADCHKNRRNVPEFPDRDDSAEAKYHKNLLDRLTNEGDLTEAELRYLTVQNALDRRFSDAEVKVLNKARKV